MPHPEALKLVFEGVDVPVGVVSTTVCRNDQFDIVHVGVLEDGLYARLEQVVAVVKGWNDNTVFHQKVPPVTPLVKAFVVALYVRSESTNTL